jgi:hypothetical protein
LVQELSLLEIINEQKWFQIDINHRSWNHNVKIRRSLGDKYQPQFALQNGAALPMSTKMCVKEPKKIGLPAINE